MDSETQKLIDFAESLADAGREICLEAMTREQVVTLKPDASFVTETDLAIERRLREMIEKAFPDHGIFGEEFSNRDTDASHVWVLDPIDGTAAFIAGIPVYGTLIGLARDGQPYLGVIDHPASDDRWIGISGKSTAMNGKQVRTRAVAKLEGTLMTCSNPDFFEGDEYSRFRSLRDRVQYTQYGGSCYAYGSLASGRTDIAIDSKMDPVDVFACAAVIEGAGGSITDWSGQPISLDWTGQVLATANEQLHQVVLSVLTEQD